MRPDDFYAMLGLCLLTLSGGLVVVATALGMSATLALGIGVSAWGVIGLAVVAAVQRKGGGA